MKQCRYCGAELPDEAKACSNCGRILEDPEQVSFEEAVKEEAPAVFEQVSVPADREEQTSSMEETGTAEPSHVSEGFDLPGEEENAEKAAAPTQENTGVSFAEEMMKKALDEEARARTEEAQREKAAPVKEEPVTEKRGKGYWQYGEWHPLEDLDKNAAAAREVEQEQGNQENEQRFSWDRQNSLKRNGWGQQSPNQGDGWNQQSPNQGNGWNQQNPNQGNGWNQQDQGQRYGWNAQGGYPPQKRTSGLAVASLSMGILSIMFYAFIFPEVLAVVFGIAALVQMKKNPELVGGKWLAIIGLIMGVIFIGIAVFAYAAAVQLMKDPAFMKYFQEYMDSLNK